MPVEVGIGPAIKKREKDVPVHRRHPAGRGVRLGRDDRRTRKRALAMLDEVMKEYKIDAEAAVPDRPVDGRDRHLEHRRGPPGPVGGDRPRSAAAATPKTAEKIKDLPCWCFHGDADTRREGRTARAT